MSGILFCEWVMGALETLAPRAYNCIAKPRQTSVGVKHPVSATLIGGDAESSDGVWHRLLQSHEKLLSVAVTCNVRGAVGVIESDDTSSRSHTNI